MNDVCESGLDNSEAGAPDTEIEVTPEMIQAGLLFIEREALNTVSVRVMSPDFIRDFCRAVLSPCLRRSDGPF